jgi:hypothetical protein
MRRLALALALAGCSCAGWAPPIAMPKGAVAWMRLPGYREHAQAVALSATGGLLAVHTTMERVRLFEWPSLRPLRIIEVGRPGLSVTLGFSARADKLVVGDRFTARVYETASGTLLWEGRAEAVAFSPSDDSLAVAEPRGQHDRQVTVRVLRFEGERVASAHEFRFDPDVRPGNGPDVPETSSLAFSADGRRLAVTSLGRWCGVYELGGALTGVTVSCDDHPFGTVDVARSGVDLVAVSQVPGWSKPVDDGQGQTPGSWTLQMWRLPDGHPLGRIDVPEMCWNIAVHPASGRLLTDGQTPERRIGLIRLWDLAAGRLVAEAASSDVNLCHLSLMELSDDGRFVVASGGHHGVLVFWDLEALAR